MSNTFLDPFDDAPTPPAPKPKVRPKSTPTPPAPVPASVPSLPGPAPRTYSLSHLLLAIGLTIVGMVGVATVLVLVSAWSERGPEPSVDAVKLGRSFVKPLAESLADGFEAHAKAMEGGKTAGDADQILKDTFHASRTKAFTERASAPFAALVPAGTEPKDDETRREFIRLHRDFAKGLRQAR